MEEEGGKGGELLSLGITGSFIAPSTENFRGCRLQTQPSLGVQTGGFAAGACVKAQAKKAEREGKL